MSANIQLQSHSLTKQFGGLIAVDSVSFDLFKGEICSIIGPNGAGKTTFFNLITGELDPTGGEILLRCDGHWEDITTATTFETAQLGLQRTYQVTNIFPDETVAENVRIASQAYSNDSVHLYRRVTDFEEHYAEAERVIRLVGLEGEEDTLAGELSHGGKRQLELALAVAGDPSILLLDEPTAGISSQNVNEMVEIIEKLSEKYTILLVEHNMDLVMDLSDRIVVLHNGSVIADGPPESIRQNEKVKRAYLREDV